MTSVRLVAFGGVLPTALAVACLISPAILLLADAPVTVALTTRTFAVACAFALALGLVWAGLRPFAESRKVLTWIVWGCCVGLAATYVSALAGTTAPPSLLLAIVKVSSFGALFALLGRAGLLRRSVPSGPAARPAS